MNHRRSIFSQKGGNWSGGGEEFRYRMELQREYGTSWEMMDLFDRDIGKDDWVDIKDKGGEVTHTMQKDTFSCGVFIMQMAKEVAQNLPNIHSQIDMEPSQKQMEQLRKEMAEDILKMSEFNKANNCFM
ncbi:uncharacterized protein wu:fc27b11 [Salvelinus fontinalis]|uniref:uncharacterized protein wu:fc27b11 n=1 Tax=Salvelinus fontinalis TaxID=8038 RepID=UPI002486AE32|nr:uncharacterized protein wu:fc27b11 [Salvelinus fontinalis]